MKHTINPDDIGPLGDFMAKAVTRCIHCGYCLPACPTYAVLGEEMDSPRGRIILMKSALEGSIDLDEALIYIDRCLGCLGCTAVCPSGVPYGELLTPFRSYAEERRHRSISSRLTRSLTREIIPNPDRFLLAAKIGKVAKPVAGVLPVQMKAMLTLLPDELPSTQPLPAIYPPKGARKARVALLTGCVQQALAPQINWATLRVLARNGVEVIIPTDQVCCGGLALHTGDKKSAIQQSIANLKVFPHDVDAVLTNAAGCGSALHEYPLLLHNTEWSEEAREFSRRAVDISVFLKQLGIEAPPSLPEPINIVYHDACHLAHAQHVNEEPRWLLQQIPNLTLLNLPEADLCCGSAGSYNIEQPEIAGILGERKVQNILSTNADAVVTGNIGCLIQIRSHLANQFQGNGKSPLPVLHTIEVLDRAYHSQ